jgi:hypothetical protein
MPGPGSPHHHAVGTQVDGVDDLHQLQEIDLFRFPDEARVAELGDEPEGNGAS